MQQVVQTARHVYCRPVMYRLFIWLGAKRIQQVMEAKGYILGTTQVSSPSALLCIMLEDREC